MLTEQEVDDPSQVGPLREQIPQEIEQITADGAYDGEPTCETIARRDPDIAVVIPPRVTGLVSAAFDAKPSPRDTHLLMIESLGRLGWQEISGYARRRWWRPRWDATSPLSGREFVRATGADRRLKQRSASPFSTACLRLVGRTPSAPRVALLEIVGEGVTSIYAASLHQRSGHGQDVSGHGHRGGRRGWSCATAVSVVRMSNAGRRGAPLLPSWRAPW